LSSTMLDLYDAGMSCLRDEGDSRGAGSGRLERLESSRPENSLGFF
jgi:hypothetical protein